MFSKGNEREASEPTSPTTTCKALCSLPEWEPKNKHAYPPGQRGQEDKAEWEGLPLTAKSWNKLGIMFPLAEAQYHCSRWSMSGKDKPPMWGLLQVSWSVCPFWPSLNNLKIQPWSSCPFQSWRSSDTEGQSQKGLGEDGRQWHFTYWVINLIHRQLHYLRGIVERSRLR